MAHDYCIVFVGEVFIVRVTIGLVLSGFLLIAAPPLDAAVFTFDCVTTGTCPTSNGAGSIIASTFAFDDATLDFSWTATFAPHNGHVPDGVWFAINDGPNPKDTDGGLAIFYGEGDSGTVSAYVYDDDEGNRSFLEPGIFIHTFPNAISFSDLPNGNVELSVALNVASVNGAFPLDPDWKGLFYQDVIGFWTAALSDSAFAFDDDGRLLAFSYEGRTSFDRSNMETTEHKVPEPATTGLLLFGLVAVSVARARSSRG